MAPGTAKCETGRAAMDGRESHNPNQDGEFMAVRFSLKQAAGAVGAGAMSEPGQVNHALMRLIFRAKVRS